MTSPIRMSASPKFLVRPALRRAHGHHEFDCLARQRAAVRAAATTRAAAGFSSAS
jgi:hypothetical protein